MSIYFITGNTNKFADAKRILPDLEQLEIDLPEIQELDPKEVIKAKLREATKHHAGEFIIDDVSLNIDGLNGFPGPLVKWFIQALSLEGVARLVQSINQTSAEVKTIIGYAKNPDEIYFFESSKRGSLVSPRGRGGFGWDVIFQPEGSEQTYAELKEKNPGPNEMRLEALNKLKHFLEQ